MERKIHILF